MNQSYAVIENKGLIMPEDIKLLGSSTKREDSTKIGQFGSGFKYAIAWLMRNGCNPIIYSGENQIKIGIDFVDHRNTTMSVITVNNERTSITTELGLKWTGWMALREIISNAIDEGEYNVQTMFNPVMEGKKDISRIYIPLNQELNEMFLNYQNYFSFDRVADYQNEHGRIFFKKEKSICQVYRKGIKCYNWNKETLIDVDLFDVEINESRLISSRYDLELAVTNIVKDAPLEVLYNVIKSEYIDFLPELNDNIKNHLRTLAKTNTFTCSALQDLGGMILSGADSLKITNRYYDFLVKENLVESPFAKLNGNSKFRFIETNDMDLKPIRYYLSQFNLNTVEIKVGSFSSSYSVKEVDGVFFIKSTTTLSPKQLATKILASVPEDIWSTVII